jgi:hypothetical protein
VSKREGEHGSKSRFGESLHFNAPLRFAEISLTQLNYKWLSSERSILGLSAVIASEAKQSMAAT